MKAILQAYSIAFRCPVYGDGFTISPDGDRCNVRIDDASDVSQGMIELRQDLDAST